MIACTECGFHNLDRDTFCGSCGGFLEWTGEALVSGVDVSAPAEPLPAKRSLRQRIQTALSLDVTSPGEAGPSPNDGDGSPGAGGPPGTPGGAGAGRPSTAAAPPGSAVPPPRRSGSDGGPPGSAVPPPRRSGSDGGPPGSAVPPPRRSGREGGSPGSATPPPGTSGYAAADAPTRDGGDAEAAALIAPRSERPAAPTAVMDRRDVPAGTSPAVVAPGPGGLQTPGSGPVAPVKPRRPEERKRPVRQPPSRKVEPGDLICGACGEGNPPARNFCSRCGATLVGAVVAEPRWWQRLVPARRRRVSQIGARPWSGKDGRKQRRRRGRMAAVYARLRPIVAVTILVAGLVVGLHPDLRERATSKVSEGSDWVMSRLQKRYSPLAPVEVWATPADPARPVELVTDSNTLTAWVGAAEPEPAIIVRFDEPFDLDRITLWNGTAEGFKDHGRIRDLHLVFDNGQTFDLTVADLPDPKTYDIDNGEGVQEIEIHLLSTYASLVGADVAISEIEFLFQT